MTDERIKELADKWNLFPTDNAWDEVMGFAYDLLAEKQDQKTPLKVLNLTVFTENRLRNGRVYDVETLQAMTSRDILAIPDMGKKALAEVLEALNVHAVNISQERVDETAKCKQEPYGYVWTSLRDGMEVRFSRMPPNKFYNPQDIKPVYTAPQKREWVGLTKDQVDSWELPDLPTVFEFAQFIEAKLKEKNT